MFTSNVGGGVIDAMKKRITALSLDLIISKEIVLSEFAIEEEEDRKKNKNW